LKIVTVERGSEVLYYCLSMYLN